MPAVQAIPADYLGITPYLIVDDAAAAIAYYSKAFGAVETLRIAAPDGRIGHAEMRIRGQPLMLASPSPECQAQSPTQLGGSPVGLMLYVDDVDATFAQAVELGATARGPVDNQFYGDRTGSLVDPFGHTWHIASRIEALSETELHARAKTAGWE
ncbi:VOC family protein [Jeongeupia sp. HS-3]|uniref:VOC family protein n=1 Tax=Jeongeupia sp. HS-3 TaxID=1009682 RepID=UPI001910362F|nr:VOC family protein [Jeongeupia sp. HS-3]